MKQKSGERRRGESLARRLGSGERGLALRFLEGRLGKKADVSNLEAFRLDDGNRGPFFFSIFDI
jgi:hypothetical protein